MQTLNLRVKHTVQCIPEKNEKNGEDHMNY